MRVTPKTIVSPAAMMKSDDALARPLSACTRRKDGSGKRWPRCLPLPMPGEAWGEGVQLLLPCGLHLGVGEEVLGAVLVLPILHGAALSLPGGLADPGAHGRLLVERADGHGADRGGELEIALEGGDQLLRVGGAGLVEQVAHHVADGIAEERAQPRRVVEFGAVGIDEGLVRRLGDLLP